MSTLISLNYQKINDFTCIITEIEESINNYPNSDLEETEHKNDAMTTCLMFLCDIIEKNKIQNEIIEKLKLDLKLSKDELITSKYLNIDLVKKIVNDIEIVSYNPSLYLLNDLNISEEKKLNFKNEILSNKNPELFEIYIEENECELFYIDILRNLETLKKYISWEQICKIRPGYVFKLTLNKDYLKEIESMNKIESTLDTWICEWLER